MPTLAGGEGMNGNRTPPVPPHRPLRTLENTATQQLHTPVGATVLRPVRTGVRRGRGVRRARYGAAPPASRVLRIAARRPPAALDPGASAAPMGKQKGQAGACPTGRAAH